VNQTNGKLVGQQPVSPALRIFTAFIPVLALADGVLHLTLDYVLFHGLLIGSAFPSGPRPGGITPPPGSRPGPPLPMPLPLNEMFLLNFVGYVVLAIVFLVSPRWLGKWRWLVNVAMIGYAATAFLAWLDYGRPNPQGLGYLSKGIEIVLIMALGVHIWVVLRKTPGVKLY
jgi:hypothetical protein